jgi:hypothetical protein
VWAPHGERLARLVFGPINSNTAERKLKRLLLMDSSRKNGFTLSMTDLLRMGKSAPAPECLVASLKAGCMNSHPVLVRSPEARNRDLRSLGIVDRSIFDPSIACFAASKPSTDPRFRKRA